MVQLALPPVRLVERLGSRTESTRENLWLKPVARLTSGMVEIPGFRAFQFSSDLDRIEDAFKVSISAMDQAYQSAETAYDRYEDSGEDDDEYDDEGVLISSTRHQLPWEAMQKSMARTVIREAFVTSIFHFWEYSARSWTSDQDVDFRGLRRKVRALGYPVDSDGLTLLNKLNNLLKHDNAETGAKLFSRAPRLFLDGARTTRDTLAQRVAHHERGRISVHRRGARFRPYRPVDPAGAGPQRRSGTTPDHCPR
jgi:hypothetical protein